MAGAHRGRCGFSGPVRRIASPTAATSGSPRLATTSCSSVTPTTSRDRRGSPRWSRRSATPTSWVAARSPGAAARCHPSTRRRSAAAGSGSSTPSSVRTSGCGARCGRRSAASTRRSRAAKTSTSPGAAQLAGYRLVSVPDAFVYYRIDAAPSRVFRKWMHYGTDQPALHARFAASGMPHQAPYRALARWAVLVLTSYRLATGPGDRRERWLQEAGRRVGRVIGSIRYRTLFL